MKKKSQLCVVGRQVVSRRAAVAMSLFGAGAGAVPAWELLGNKPPSKFRSPVVNGPPAGAGRAPADAVHASSAPPS